MRVRMTRHIGTAPSIARNGYLKRGEEVDVREAVGASWIRGGLAVAVDKSKKGEPETAVVEPETTTPPKPETATNPPPEKAVARTGRPKIRRKRPA